jgi:tRNA-modifying protein YgfZ
MTQTSLPSISATCAIALPERRVISVSGPDAREFLNQLLTANLKTLKPGEAVPSALLSPQGKVIVDFLILDASDEEPLFLIDCRSGMAGDLALRLTRYKLRSKVEIAVLDETIGVRVILGDDLALSQDLSLQDLALKEEFYAFADPRHPGLGTRWIGPQDVLAKASAGLIPAEAETYHTRRVALGIPEWGKDFVFGDAFAHEILLDQLNGVDFQKGCYIGQEIVSRMEHRNSARTRALPLRFLNGFGVITGCDLLAGETILGKLGESHGGRAIGLLRLDRLEDAYAAGLSLSAGGVECVVETLDFARFKIPQPAL